MVLTSGYFADCIGHSNSVHLARADVVQVVRGDVVRVVRGDVVQVVRDDVDQVDTDHVDVLNDVEQTGDGKSPGVGIDIPEECRAGSYISWSARPWCEDTRGPCRTCACSTAHCHS